MRITTSATIVSHKAFLHLTIGWLLTKYEKLIDNEHDQNQADQMVLEDEQSQILYEESMQAYRQNYQIKELEAQCRSFSFFNKLAVLTNCELFQPEFNPIV